jgi:thioredoxin-dependent peroxiredoxin
MTKLQAGDQAPAFRLESTNGTQDLSNLTGKWTVLYFYPKDHTPGCTKEACDFRDALPGMKAHVIGVSPDDLKSHEKFGEDYSLPFPLASDSDSKFAKDYGAWGKKQNFGKEYEGLIRSTFIIDPTGKVAEAMYNVKADGHAEKVSQRLSELQAGPANVGEHA